MRIMSPGSSAPRGLGAVSAVEASAARWRRFSCERQGRDDRAQDGVYRRCISSVKGGQAVASSRGSIRIGSDDGGEPH